MENLIKLRNSRHLTQQELAEYLNIARTTYQCYEQKKSEPNIDTLIKLADYFNCSIDYLLGHQTANIVQLDSFTPAQLELLEMIKQLSDFQCGLLVAYANGLNKGLEERREEFNLKKKQIKKRIKSMH